MALRDFIDNIREYFAVRRVRRDLHRRSVPLTTTALLSFLGESAVSSDAAASSSFAIHNPTVTVIKRFKPGTFALSRAGSVYMLSTYNSNRMFPIDGYLLADPDQRNISWLQDGSSSTSKHKLPHDLIRIGCP